MRSHSGLEVVGCVKSEVQLWIQAVAPRPTGLRKPRPACRRARISPRRSPRSRRPTGRVFFLGDKIPIKPKITFFGGARLFFLPLKIFVGFEIGPAQKPVHPAGDLRSSNSNPSAIHSIPNLRLWRRQHSAVCGSALCSFPARRRRSCGGAHRLTSQSAPRAEPPPPSCLSRAAQRPGRRNARAPAARSSSLAGGGRREGREGRPRVAVWVAVHSLLHSFVQAEAASRWPACGADRGLLAGPGDGFARSEPCWSWSRRGRI